jgi:hypothetical protein
MNQHGDGPCQKLMTIPFFSFGVAILYFGWLWHDRSATDRSQGGLLSRSPKDSNRTGETHAAQTAPVESVIQKPFSLGSVYTPTASGAVGSTQEIVISNRSAVTEAADPRQSYRPAWKALVHG